MNESINELMKKNCWIVQLKPFGNDEDDVYEKIKVFQSECIYKNFFAMGWALSEKQCDIKCGAYLNDNNNYTKYIEDGSTSYGTDPRSGRVRCLKHYNEMNEGDLVIFRNTDTGCYYVSRITKKAHYMYSEQKREQYYDHISWGCNVSPWLPVNALSEIPSIILGKFSSSRQQTSENVSVSELKQAIIMLYLRKAFENDEYKKNLYREKPIILNRNNYATCLSYSLLESLVYLYMMDKPINKDFIIWPSTWKTGFQKFEFLMKNKDNEYITCQVKNQSSWFPEPKDYENNKDLKRIYLFHGKWVSDNKLFHEYEQKVKEQASQKNLEIIDPTELFHCLVKYSAFFTDDYMKVKQEQG